MVVRIMDRHAVDCHANSVCLQRVNEANEIKKGPREVPWGEKGPPNQE
jgi:hypothetical protein